MEATAASKDLKYGTVLLKSLVQKALKERPAAVIITGDVTFNGAKKSATQLAKIFKPLTDNQINFLVIPGNHDIYDGWARSFKGKHEYKTEQISPEDWHHIFKSSYENATSVDPASLSYTVQLNDQYQLLLLDTNKYSVGPATTAPYTSGTIRPATIKWLEQQLKEGQKKKGYGRLASPTTTFTNIVAAVSSAMSSKILPLCNDSLVNMTSNSTLPGIFMRKILLRIQQEDVQQSRY